MHCSHSEEDILQCRYALLDDAAIHRIRAEADVWRADALREKESDR